MNGGPSIGAVCRLSAARDAMRRDYGIWTEPHTLRYALPRDGGRPAAASSGRSFKTRLPSFGQHHVVGFVQVVLGSVGWTVRQMVQHVWARDCGAPYARSELEGKSRSASRSRRKGGRATWGL